MTVEQQKVGPHPRLPWTDVDPRHVLAHCRWDQLKGTFRASAKEAARGTELYNRAKTDFDQNAAADLVDRMVNRGAVNKIIDALIAANMPARIVFPHPEFDPTDGFAGKPTNAIPFAFAAYLAEVLGGDIETDIVEIARPGRTKLGNFPRFLWQPKFDGAVARDRAYIIADDNCTLGGTLTILRHHIASHGGTVAAITALSTQSGLDFRLPIAESTLGGLFEIYSEGLTEYWIERIGHDIRCLSEPEGAFLVEWGQNHNVGTGPGALKRLRDRIDEAAAKGK